MIKISGVAKYSVSFEVELDMTADEFDDLGERKQNELIDNFIGLEEMESAEMDDCDVWDLEEIDEEGES